MMEIGKKYKITYKDKEYIFLVSGILLNEDEHLICIDDIKDGKTFVGKSAIVRIKELGDLDHDKHNY